MGCPLIAGFVEIQHEPKKWAWSGETTESRASLSDCHNKARIMSDEDVVKATYHCCFMQLWNLILKIFIRADLHLQLQ
jgi:hypothetical protein